VKGTLRKLLVDTKVLSMAVEGAETTADATMALAAYEEVRCMVSVESILHGFDEVVQIIAEPQPARHGCARTGWSTGWPKSSQYTGRKSGFGDVANSPGETPTKE
jgi:hypothetical protein